MVSIIMPVYNVAQYLKKCIDSIIAQSFDAWELILVDDGSSDGSQTICDEYAAADARIQVLHKENGGVSSARNLGLEKKTGEYVLFLDADDWIEPQMLELLVNAAEQNQADIAACDVYHARILENHEIERTCAYKWGKLDAEKVYTGEEIFYQIMNKSATLWNKLFRTDLVGDTVFDTAMTYAEDTDFLFKVMKDSRKVVAIPYVGYNYVYNRPGNVVSAGISPKTLEHIKNTKLLYDQMHEIGMGALGVYRIFMVLNRHLCKMPYHSFGDQTYRPYRQEIRKAAYYPSLRDRISFYFSGRFPVSKKVQYLLICISPYLRILYRKILNKNEDGVV